MDESKFQEAIADFKSKDDEVKSQPEAKRELTFGEKAVGLTFNPGGHEEVNDIKKTSARLIDQLDNARNLATSGDRKRMYSEAITNIQTGQMWGVKAATWQF